VINLDKLVDEPFYQNDTYIWDLEQAKTDHVFCRPLAASIDELIFRYQPDEEKQNFVDLGCGKGSYLAYLKERHPTSQFCGIEGTPDIDKIAEFSPIFQGIDLSKSLRDNPQKTAAWRNAHVICLEVMEHLTEEDQHVLLDNIDFCCGSECFLIFSVATPLQDGLGHHNNLSSYEAICLIERRGYTLRVADTFRFRHFVDKSASWFQNTLLIFRRL